MVENDKNVSDYMSNVNKNDSIDSATNTEFFNTLSEYCKWSNYIISIIPLTTDKKIMDPLYSQYPYSELIYGNKALDNFIESGYSNKFSFSNTFPFNYEDPDYEKKTTITYFSRYLDKENYSLIGYLMMNIKKKNLFMATLDLLFIFMCLNSQKEDNNMYKVMIVDDEIPAREILSYIINWEETDFRIAYSASNGKEALDKYSNIKPDLIITDIQMPIMDGLDLIEEIQKINKSQKFLILSCYEDFTYAQRAMKMGVTDYLIKDLITPNDLYGILAKTKSDLDSINIKNSENGEFTAILRLTSTTSGVDFVPDKELIF